MILKKALADKKDVAIVLFLHLHKGCLSDFFKSNFITLALLELFLPKLQNKVKFHLLETCGILFIKRNTVTSRVQVKAREFKYFNLTQSGDSVKSGCEKSCFEDDYPRLPKVDVLSLGACALWQNPEKPLKMVYLFMSPSYVILYK